MQPIKRFHSGESSQFDHWAQINMYRPITRNLWLVHVCLHDHLLRHKLCSKNSYNSSRASGQGHEQCIRFNVYVFVVCVLGCVTKTSCLESCKSEVFVIVSSSDRSRRKLLMAWNTGPTNQVCSTIYTQASSQILLASCLHRTYST